MCNWRDMATDLMSGHSWHRALGALLQRFASFESGEGALQEARKIWPDQLPPVIVGALASQLPPFERAKLIPDSLRAAKDVEDAANRSVALASLVPHLDDERSREEALREVAGALAEVLRQERGASLLSDLILSLPVLPAPRHLFPLIQALVHRTSMRRDLLDYIRKLNRIIENLGGVDTPGSVADAVLTVSRWWH